MYQPNGPLMLQQSYNNRKLKTLRAADTIECHTRKASPSQFL